MSTKAGLLSLAALAGVPYKSRKIAGDLYNVGSLAYRTANKFKTSSNRPIKMVYRRGLKRSRYMRRYKRRYRPSKRYGKRYKKRTFTPKAIAYPPNLGSCKGHAVLSLTLESQDTRTLYYRELTDIGKGQERDDRERDLINLRGFKICFATWNATDKPLYFNWAIVSPKGCAVASEGNSVSETNFFRAYGTTRDADFSTNLASTQFHCLAINTDVWSVLKHKRTILAEKTGTNFAFRNTHTQFKLIHKYIKINRSVRYNDDRCTTPIFMVWWYDDVQAGQGEPALTNAVRSHWHRTAFFREPKS